MAGPPTPNAAQVTCVFGGEATPTGGVATAGIITPAGGFTPAVLDELADIFGDFHAEMATIATTLERIELKVGPEATGPTYTKSIGRAGEAPGTSVPPNVAVLVRKEVEGVSGKFGGRMYWPGVPEATVGPQGDITPSHLASLQTAANTLFTRLNDGDYTPAVFGSADGALPAVKTVARFAVQGRVATQRRRLRR